MSFRVRACKSKSSAGHTRKVEIDTRVVLLPVTGARVRRETARKGRGAGSAAVNSKPDVIIVHCILNNDPILSTTFGSTGRRNRSTQCVTEAVRWGDAGLMSSVGRQTTFGLHHGSIDHILQQSKGGASWRRGGQLGVYISSARRRRMRIARGPRAIDRGAVKMHGTVRTACALALASALVAPAASSITVESVALVGWSPLARLDTTWSALSLLAPHPD